MPEKVVFVLSTGRTGTKALAEGLCAEDVLSRHQPPFSRILTIAANYHLYGWLPLSMLEKMVEIIRERQIRKANCRYYVQAFALDFFPARIITEKIPDVSIIHIVRDPKTFVPSYLNWMNSRFKSFVANRLVPGWHPSGFFTGEMGFGAWNKMSSMEKVCWHWVFKNSLLESMFQEYSRYKRIFFEDLFSQNGPTVLKDALEFAGVPYNSRYDNIFRKKKNTSKRQTVSLWEKWPVQKKNALLEICSDKMKDYGYL